ncbi:MAG: LysR family transcriptional regulator, partial [Deltaproteobacteria bacterium]|nr:LysR family transcriptional regulator [Deltaproteobacteria bacterium]
KHLNMTKASAELHITQPSVSQQLKFLEGECKVKLYTKMSRGIELTERGQLLLNDAEPILLQIERLKEKFKDSSTDGKVGSLTIGGSHSLSVSFLPTMLAVFKETHSHVQVTFRTDNSRAVERMVLNSEAELGVLTNPSYSPSFIHEPCRQEELVAFASANHPLAKKQKLTLEELAQAPLVVKRDKTSKVYRTDEIFRQLEARGFKLNIVMNCESPEALKATVKTGMGLGILYRDIVEPYVKTGELKIIKVPELKMKIDSCIIYLKGKEKALSPHFQDFLTLLREWPKKLKPGRVDVSLR